jgi:hypothetical protein
VTLDFEGLNGINHLVLAWSVQDGLLSRPYAAAAGG